MPRLIAWCAVGAIGLQPVSAAMLPFEVHGGGSRSGRDGLGLTCCCVSGFLEEEVPAPDSCCTDSGGESPGTSLHPAPEALEARPASSCECRSTPAPLPEAPVVLRTLATSEGEVHRALSLAAMAPVSMADPPRPDRPAEDGPPPPGRRARSTPSGRAALETPNFLALLSVARL